MNATLYPRTSRRFSAVELAAVAALRHAFPDLPQRTLADPLQTSWTGASFDDLPVSVAELLDAADREDDSPVEVLDDRSDTSVYHAIRRFDRECVERFGVPYAVLAPTLRVEFIRSYIGC